MDIVQYSDSDYSYDACATKLLQLICLKPISIGTIGPYLVLGPLLQVTWTPFCNSCRDQSVVMELLSLCPKGYFCNRVRVVLSTHYHPPHISILRVDACIKKDTGSYDSNKRFSSRGRDETMNFGDVVCGGARR